MSAYNCASRSAMRLMTTPAKVASNLNWKKNMGASIMTLDIGHDVIGVAIANHPSTTTTSTTTSTMKTKTATTASSSVQILEPITKKLETRSSLLRRRRCRQQSTTERVLAPNVVDELQSIIRTYKVCGFIISWPVQKEGRCGAPCGIVLHALDSIVKESSSILTPDRPFCLWDGHHIQPAQEDQWHRSPIYSKPCTQPNQEHKASIEQYQQQHHQHGNNNYNNECNNSSSSSKVAASIWNDFCKVHWPQFVVDDNSSNNSSSSDNEDYGECCA